MDQFVKVKKKMSMAESTRQVLNRSIDLLHKLSNKKIVLDAAKKELSSALSSYYVSIYPSSENLDEGHKMRFSSFLERANDILLKVDAGKTPLYEAIMMMNKVVMEHKPTDAVESDSFESEFVSSEFDPSGREVEPAIAEKEMVEEEAIQEVIAPKQLKAEVSTKLNATALLEEVIRHKKELEKSILSLNETLHDLGFELRAR